MAEHNWVFCPLVDEKIEDIDCIENRDAVDNLVLDETVPTRFKIKLDWREICTGCRWHRY